MMTLLWWTDHHALQKKTVADDPATVEVHETSDNLALSRRAATSERRRKQGCTRS